MPGNPRKRKKRHLSSLAKRNNELNFKKSKGRRDTNSDSQTMSNSQDEGEESTESLLKPTSLGDGNSHCSSAFQEDISFLPLTVDILPSHIFHAIDNTQDENEGSIESKQECLSVEDANSHCNNPSQKDSLFSSESENNMLSQTFQSISSTSQDKSERSIESPQEISLLGEANSDCNNPSQDIPSQTFQSISSTSQDKSEISIEYPQEISLLGEANSDCNNPSQDIPSQTFQSISSTSQDKSEISIEYPQEISLLGEANSDCNNPSQDIPSQTFQSISSTSQDKSERSIEYPQEISLLGEANSDCNNPSQDMPSQTFQSISSTSQDKSERSIESPQEISLLGEANSDCNNPSQDMPSQTFCPDYINLNFKMDEENVKNLCVELDKTTILQNLEEKFASLQLSPKQKNRKISSCVDLSTEKDHKLDPEDPENVITNISKQEINIEEWEEGQEIEVKVIEPTSIYLPEPSISYEMTDGKYSYWSSVGLLTNKRRDPLYLGPDNEDVNKVFESLYNEEVIRLTSPTYIELEDLPEENISVECATEEVKKPLESENNEQVMKLTSPVLIESDDWSKEIPSLECETNTMDYIQYDLMDEISLGGENNIESLNNDETVERLQLKEKKKSFFGRLIGGIFGCFLNKKQKVR